MILCILLSYDSQYFADDGMGEFDFPANVSCFGDVIIDCIIERDSDAIIDGIVEGLRG